MQTVEECQALAKKIAKKLGIRRCPIVELRDNVKGNAWRDRNLIVIPLWVLGRSIAYYTGYNEIIREKGRRGDYSYAWYYIIHEVCHFAPAHFDECHTKGFLETEQKMLKEFGIEANIKRVFPTPNGVRWIKDA